MATPALAKPARRLLKLLLGPDVKEKTINSLSPLATGNATSALPTAVSPALAPDPKVGAKSTKTPDI
jgi:hypothetical protein